MVAAGRGRGRDVVRADLNEYEPAAPVQATTIFRAIYYARDRRALLERIAGYTERKLVFDLNPRQYRLEDVRADLGPQASTGSSCGRSSCRRRARGRRSRSPACRGAHRAGGAILLRTVQLHVLCVPLGSSLKNVKATFAPSCGRRRPRRRDVRDELLVDDDVRGEAGAGVGSQHTFVCSLPMVRSTVFVTRPRTGTWWSLTASVPTSRCTGSGRLGRPIRRDTTTRSQPGLARGSGSTRCRWRPSSRRRRCRCTSRAGGSACRAGRGARPSSAAAGYTCVVARVPAKSMHGRSSTA